MRFHGEGGLGPAGAAYRSADLLVGVNYVAVDVAVGHQVPAAEHLRAARAGLAPKPE